MHNFSVTFSLQFLDSLFQLEHLWVMYTSKLLLRVNNRLLNLTLVFMVDLLRQVLYLVVQLLNLEGAVGYLDFGLLD